MNDMYTCNGSLKGCDRERFGHCVYHDRLAWADKISSFTGEIVGVRSFGEGYGMVISDDAAEQLCRAIDELKEFEHARDQCDFDETETGRCCRCGRYRGGP